MQSVTKTNRSALYHSCLEAHKVTHISPVAQTAPMAQNAVYFPLTPDHELLHLISFNISRAVLTNYFLISSIPSPPSSYCSTRRIFKLPSSEEMETWLEPSHEALASTATLPPALIPTRLQQTIPHFGWIDLFPSPQLRDNIIMAMEWRPADENILMVDLVGRVLDDLCASGEASSASGTQLGQNTEWVGHNTASSISRSSCTPSDRRMIPSSGAGEPGLVSWSDPWDIGGWEFTEEFAQKWGFLLEGCSDVVAAANKWRYIRGDDPLVFEV